MLSYRNEVCRDKALEILSKSPKWKPATIDGKAVPCRYDSVIINFRFHR
ncbi:MAG: energy transducer TonB [Alistipes sp.]|nr:energy transducer TonB [Alistipes sp.]